MATKTKKILEWVIFSFLFIILLASSALLFYQKSYSGKIYRNVYVSNADMSGKTKEQARFIIGKMFKTLADQEIVIKADDKEVKTKLSDTGLDIDINQVVNQCYKIGRNENFIAQLLTSARTVWVRNEVFLSPKIDDKRYQSFLDIAVAQLNTKPEDAKIVIEGGDIKETPEKDGRIVKTENLVQKILGLATQNGIKTILLDTIIAPSTIKAADWEDAKSYAQTILNKKITLTYEDKNYFPSRENLSTWVSFSFDKGKYNASLNENGIKAYLNKIGSDFEIKRIDKKINALDNSVIQEGRQGKYLNKDDAIVKIKASLENSNDANILLVTYTEDPKELKVIPAEGLMPGRFEGKYVDIDLTQQKLCRIEGANILDCFLISSGKPGMATPTGTFSIQSKNPRQFSYLYSMWLPWWEQINGDIGIHELPETNTWKETPEHLGTPVSHGCIRLGVGPAQTVYEWTEIGTPVYVHK